MADAWKRGHPELNIPSFTTNAFWASVSFNELMAKHERMTKSLSKIDRFDDCKHGGPRC
jgi:hypothetical protein